MKTKQEKDGGIASLGISKLVLLVNYYGWVQTKEDQAGEACSTHRIDNRI
jgi:hypothetical protein